MNEEKYLESIVTPLITGSMSVEKKVDDRGILLTVFLENKEDIGRVIGKAGETAKAIRRLVRQYGMTNDKRIAMKIFEPNKDGNKGNTEKVSNVDLEF